MHKNQAHYLKFGELIKLMIRKKNGISLIKLNIFHFMVIVVSLFGQLFEWLNIVEKFASEKCLLNESLFWYTNCHCVGRKV